KTSRKELSQLLKNHQTQRGQHLYPIVDEQGAMIGVATRRDLQRLVQEGSDGQSSSHTLSECVKTSPVVAYEDETLRTVVYRMAETGYTRFPVVERTDRQHLVGMVSLSDLLKARSRNLTEERERERVLRIRFLFPSHAPRIAEPAA